MNPIGKHVVLFCVSAAAAAIVAAPAPAGASARWWRTMQGLSCDSHFSQYGDTACAFTSDSIVGMTAPGGNGGVDAIYLDVYVSQSNQGFAGVAACAESFDLLGGSCGPNALVGKTLQMGANDIGMKPWIGTGSAYDYFWVHGWLGGLNPPTFHGIGVSGVD